MVSPFRSFHCRPNLCGNALLRAHASGGAGASLAADPGSAGCYSALKLCDYGRVEMRLTADGRIYVIEANPNPRLAPEAELAIAARLAGRSDVELIGQIVELALARYAT